MQIENKLIVPQGCFDKGFKRYLFVSAPPFTTPNWNKQMHKNEISKAQLEVQQATYCPSMMKNKTESTISKLQTWAGIPVGGIGAIFGVLIWCTGAEFACVVGIANSGAGVGGADSSDDPSWKYQTPFDATV